MAKARTDLLNFYAFPKVEDLSIAAEKVSYLNYVQFQQELVTSPEGEGHLEYWQHQLSGELPVLILPTDYPRPPLQSYHGSTYSFTISAELSTRLKAFAKESGVTLYTLLLGIYKLMLYRYSGQSDLIVGSPTAGRNHANFANIAGYFVNPIAIRSQIDGSRTFGEYLSDLQQTSIMGMEHQDYPFNLLVDKLKVPRDLSRSPIFQIMFVYEKASLLNQLSEFILGEENTQMTWGDLVLEPYALKKEAAQFDLTLLMSETSKFIGGVFEYNTALFSPETIARFALHYLNLAAGVVDMPEIPVSRIPLLSKEEFEQIVYQWNDTAEVYPQDWCLHQLVEMSAVRYPEKVAIVAGEQSITYQQLNSKANQLARYLKRLGVGSEVIVGISLERSIEMVIGLLAILKAGGAYLPIATEYPQERIHFMLEDAEARLFITAEEMVQKIKFTDVQLVSLHRDAEIIAAESAENLPVEITPQNLVYVIYTSGSTGKPKGVMVEHASFINMTYARRKVFTESEKDRFSQVASLSFDACAFEIWPALTIGAALYIADDVTRRDPERLMDWMVSRQITIGFLPTPMGELVITAKWPPETSLRVLQLAGDKLHFYTEEKLPFTLYNLYGPTEATIWSTYLHVESGHSELAPPIGRPIQNVQVYILGPEMQPVPIGVKGEIYIGGQGVARGYYNRPDLNAERFVPSPFIAGERLYKTGDMGYYLPDANIAFAGRTDYQVKIRGHRIELEEIQTVIKQHPLVTNCVVLAKQNVAGAAYLVAYLTVQSGEALKVEELRSCLGELLPDYMIPQRFIFLETMPLTPNGKIDRKALPEPVAEVLGENTTDGRMDSPTAWTEEARLLAKIWIEVLGIKEVGLQDNFFSLGGDSILSIQVVSRARAVGLELTPNDLFQNQTIAELLKVIRRGGSGGTLAEQGAISGQVPLTPIQHWFFEKALVNKHHWNQGVLLEVKEKLELTSLSKAVSTIFQHHDALRSYFLQGESGYEQIIAPEVESTPVYSYDLCQLPSIAWKNVIIAEANKLQQSFDLALPPLFRVAVFTTGHDEPDYLLVLAHHLLVDGVSWRIILEDLFTVYKQYQDGSAGALLPPKTTSLQHWANQLVELAKLKDFSTELTWLKDDLPVEAGIIPVDRAGENSEGSVKTLHVSLNPVQTELLLRKVSKAYHTNITDLLVTALGLAYCKWTAAKQVLFDVESHGRENLLQNVDISRTVGWFTNLYPVFLDFSEVEALEEQIIYVKEIFRKIPANGISYGLAKTLSTDQLLKARLQHLPQAQICFNYLGQLDNLHIAGQEVKLSQMSMGDMRSPENQRRYLLEIDCSILNETFQAAWKYSANIHEAQTIQTLATYFIEALENIIQFCASRQMASFTPSDFPLVKLQQAQLTQLASKVAIQDIYPLSPLQEGMLY